MWEDGSSTHRCLGVSELLDNIVSEVALSSRQYAVNPVNRELLALSTVCQKFSSHALDVIWRNVGFIKPFKSVLPHDLMVQMDVKDGPVRYCAHFTILISYAN